MDRICAALIISNDVVAPEDYQVWMTRDVPHLAICFTEAGASISQFVTPGFSPCLACSEIQKMQDDPNWLATVTQLSQLERDLSDSVSMLAAVSVAVRRILNQIDSRTDLTNEPVDYDSISGKFQLLTPTEANCGCR